MKRMNRIEFALIVNKIGSIVYQPEFVLRQGIALIFLFAAVAFAQDQSPYPEHGTVVAVHARRISPGFDFGANDRSGPTAAVSSRAGCRVETQKRFYEFTMRGKMPPFVLGQTIDFRVEAQNVYVASQNGKPHKYRLASVEEKRMVGSS